MRRPRRRCADCGRMIARVMLGKVALESLVRHGAKRGSSHGRPYWKLRRIEPCPGGRSR